MKTIIDIRREETYRDLKSKLNRYGKCALVRPTGFGKTGILTRLLKDYKNVLYLYPTKAVRNTVCKFYGSDVIPNTRLISYRKLLYLEEQDLDSFGNVDLVIADECHKIGAKLTSKALEITMGKFKSADFVGASATPDRMDMVDEIFDFFDDIVTSEYTLHDAFEDGLLRRPYYIFCSYGNSDLKDIIRNTRLDIDQLGNERNVGKEMLKSKLIELSNLKNMSTIIGDACRKYVKDPSYLKFIVFFSDVKHIEEKGDEVSSWFQNAFPMYKVEVTRITSEKKEYRRNVDKLERMRRLPNYIDLIFCINMLNVGYHTEDLSGIVMYRGTESGIIYGQQLGRALSSGSKDSALVFDVVDNIHRKSLYQVLGEKSSISRKNEKRRIELSIKKGNNTITEEELKELNSLIKSIKREEWWSRSCKLEPKDLLPTPYEATYRELIAKIVAEPISMRCRQAWSRWKEQGGDDSVMTRDAILSRIPPEFVPLEPFCRLKNVTINQVLDVMGIK